MSGPNDLMDAATEYLAAVNEAVELGAAQSGAPPLDRVFVSPGVPSWDCGQIAVYVGSAVEADTAPLMPPLQPMRRVDMGRQLNLVTLTAVVIRCCVPVPTGEGANLLFPSGESMQAVAAQTNVDLWAIWNHLAQMKRAETLFPPKRREFIFDPAVPTAISGGCAGWQVQVRVELGGYNPSQEFEVGVEDTGATITTP
jgi:hypothetical protein